MKYFIVLAITLLAYFSFANKKENQILLDRIDDTECSRFYEFRDTIIDFYTLKKSDYKRENIVLFNDCSDYSNRFKTGRFGFELKRDSVLEDRYCKYVFTNPSTVKVTDPDYEVKYYDLPMKVTENGKEVRPYTLSHPSGIILIYDLPEELDILIYKMDYKGEIIGKLSINKIDISEVNKSDRHYERFLTAFDYRKDELVFTSPNYYYNIKKTVVVNLKDMNFKSYDFAISNVVWDDYDQFAKGFILEPEKKYDENSILKFYNLSDSSYTDLSVPYASDECQTILWGNRLFLANYSNISTGCTLHSFDLYTKTKLWTADVLQLNVDHSKYWNKVILSKYRNMILLEGNEAYGNYLQFFEVNTGKRWAEFGDVK